MAKGLAAVRAPIHSRSTPPFSAVATCSRVATSVEVYMPVSRFTRWSQAMPASPDAFEAAGFGAGLPESGAADADAFGCQRAGRAEDLLFGFGAARACDYQGAPGSIPGSVMG